MSRLAVAGTAVSAAALFVLTALFETLTALVVYGAAWAVVCVVSLAAGRGRRRRVLPVRSAPPD